MSGTCKTFFKKYLSKSLKAKCNRLGNRYRRLEEKDEINDTDDFHGSDEPSNIRDKIIEIMEPAVKRYAKDLFEGVDLKNGEDADAFEFCEVFGDDDIELYCVRRGKKGWVASVRTSYWDAPEWTCDDSTCVKTPAEAFEWGFGDAMAYHFISEEV